MSRNAVFYSLCLVFALCATASAVNAATIDVADPVALAEAMRNAKGGDIIRLAPGQYGAIKLSGKKDSYIQYSAPVSLVSTDPANRAVFNSIWLMQASNLRFEHLMFDYVATPGETLSASPFTFLESRNLVFDSVLFDGDFAKGVNAIEDGHGAGRGLIVSDSENVAVQNSTFRNWHRAAAFRIVKGLKALRNEVTGSSSDGFDFAQVEDVVIAENHMHDFQLAAGSPAHPDMIQFWTTNTTAPSRNITIVNNLLDMGAGTAPQALFMRNELVDQGLAGQEMFYQNIRIANNIIATRHHHGITVGETKGLVIEHNTVIQKAASASARDDFVPNIRVAKASADVAISSNMSCRFAIDPVGLPPDWIFANNLVVEPSNKNTPNYVGRLLVNPFEPKAAAWGDFMFTPKAAAFLAKKGKPIPGAAPEFERVDLR